MNVYRYCSVRPKDISRSYFYISDEDISVNSYVLVPFGTRDHLHKGIVESVGLYAEDDAPWPVGKTKRILRVITEEEYDADEDDEWRRYANTFAADIEALACYLDEQDYDAVFQWACEHSDCTRFPDIMETVIRCYRLCMDNGNPAAALNLGNMYYNGIYLKRDYQQAVKFYEIAAEKGERRAICNLGYCYYYGRHQPVDYERARYYYTLGVILYDDPNCLYKLGDMYRYGNAVEQSDAYAARLYFRALDAINRPDEDEFCRPDILCRLGDVFLYGMETEPDPKRALDAFLHALSGFYDRRKSDPYVSGLIEQVKERIQEAEDLLDDETL